MREKSCLVCGKPDEDAGPGVKRRVETESYWYREVLKQVLDDNHDEFQSFCTICDKLVSEYEEVSKEKKSIQLELEFRISNPEANYVEDYDDDDDDDDTHEMVINDEAESEDDEDENEGKALENGEIPDVSSFIKNDVKIFEIDVKQAPPPPPAPAPPIPAPKPERRKEVVITKFEKQNIPRQNPEPVTAAKTKPDIPRIEIGDQRLTASECQDNLICVFCLRQFSDEAAFAQHQTLHSDEQQELDNYKCQKCQKDFLSGKES